MAQLKLPKEEKLSLRAQAHHLEPVVLLGSSGLTDAVKKEIDRALNAHGLIKVRIPTDDREERVQIYETLADELGAAKIQLIGKLIVLYRPIPEKEEEPEGNKEKKETAKKPRKTGAKARNQRKLLTETIQQQKKGARKAKSLPWESKTMKMGKTPNGKVKAAGEYGIPLGKRTESRAGRTTGRTAPRQNRSN